MENSKTVVTFGTFDLLHIGHVRILQRAHLLKGNGKLIVGVSSDKLNYTKKMKYPVFSQDERIEILQSLKYVDQIFLEESLELKPQYLMEHKADILVMGDDWKGKFDFCRNVPGLEHLQIIYLPRTEDVSTTEIIEKIIQLGLR